MSSPLDPHTAPTNPLSPPERVTSTVLTVDVGLGVHCQHLLTAVPFPDVVTRPLAFAQTLLPAHTLVIQTEPNTQTGHREPLISPDGQTIGALQVRGPALTTSQRATLQGVAQAIMDSVIRAVLSEQLEQALQFTAALADIHALTADTAPPEGTAAAAVRILHRRMRVDWSGLLRLQDGQLHLLAETSAARGDHLSAALREQLTLEPAFTSPWLNRTHVFQDDYTCSDGALATLLTAGVSSAAWLALGDPDGQGPFILLLTRQDEPAVWTDQERQLLVAAARSVGIALERAATMQRLEQQARTDALTGLGNRRALDEQLQALEGQALALGVIDLNGMKRVNDERGHASGDDLLRTFARHLQDPGVQAFRLGGDEYALIGPAGETGEKRLLTLTGQAILKTQQRGFAVTAALGTVRVPEEADSLTRALRIADSRMYRDKHTDDR